MKTTPLMKGAMIAVRDCMGVKKEEKVVVITDTGKIDIAKSFLFALHALGVDATLSLMVPRSHHVEEPPSEIGVAMASVDVALLVTTTSLSHTYARMEATKKGVRIASMPGITEDMLTVGAMTADYEKVSELSWKLTHLLEATDLVEIYTEKGTDVRLSLKGRKPAIPPDDGLYRERGRWGNLPAGEAFVAPVEESVEGIVVVDGSMSPLGLLAEPIKLTIQRGKAIKIEGGREAEELSRFLEELSDPYAYWVGELGIGTNEKARITGNILEDEKALRTVHIALGMNVSIGGKVESKTHNDGIIRNPTVKFDGELIMDKGILMV